MKRDQHWLEWQGSLLLIFVPYFAGFSLIRIFRLEMGQEMEVLFPAALVLILFAGASVYGFLTTAAAFLLLGAYASGVFSRLSFVSLLNGREYMELLKLSPWFPALFGASYLGLLSTGRLLQVHGSGKKQRLKDCLCTSALQCVMIVCAALISRLLEI